MIIKKVLYFEDYTQVPKQKFEKVCISLLTQLLQYQKEPFNLLEMLSVIQLKLNPWPAKVELLVTLLSYLYNSIRKLYRIV